MARIDEAKANAAAADVLRKSAPKIAPFIVRATVFEDRRLRVLLTMGGHAFTATLRGGELVELRVGWPVS